jgi:hypothetical protein
MMSDREPQTLSCRHMSIARCTLTDEHLQHKVPSPNQQPDKPGNAMARLIAGVTTTPSFRQRVDPLTDLSLLLSRLQRTILHANAEREARLRSSEFERAKAQAVGARCSR